MAEYSHEKIYAQLERISSMPVRRIYYDGGRSGGAASEHDNAFLHLQPRFMMCLSGEMHLKMLLDNVHWGDAWLRPGELIYAAPRNRILEVWDSTYEMFASRFYPEYVRHIFIRHDGRDPMPMEPDQVFHTPKPLNPLGLDLLAAMNHAAMLAGPETTPPGGIPLFQALVQNLLSDMRSNQSLEQNKSRFLWNEIFSYVSENFAREDLDRKSLAVRFHVQEGYISRHFRAELGMSFLEYVLQQRFSLAVELLHDPTMNVDQVASACGFRYTSYFIRAFRARYHRTPGEMRGRG